MIVIAGLEGLLLPSTWRVLVSGDSGSSFEKVGRRESNQSFEELDD